jgi:hypothetical protein
MTDRKNPGVAFWATVVVVVVLVAYPLSFGPACWLVTRSDDRELMEAFHRAYRPVLEVLIQLPEVLDGPIQWCTGLGAPGDSKPFIFRHGKHCGFAWNRPGYSYTALSR